MLEVSFILSRTEFCTVKKPCSLLVGRLGHAIERGVKQVTRELVLLGAGHELPTQARK